MCSLPMTLTSQFTAPVLRIIFSSRFRIPILFKTVQRSPSTTSLHLPADPKEKKEAQFTKLNLYKHLVSINSALQWAPRRLNRRRRPLGLHFVNIPNNHRHQPLPEVRRRAQEIRRRLRAQSVRHLNPKTNRLVARKQNVRKFVRVLDALGCLGVSPIVEKIT